MVSLSICAALPLLIIAINASDAAAPPPPTPPSSGTCNYSAQVCGNLSIPYPFGMSEACGLPEYRVSCKRNSSYGDGYLAFLQNIPIPTTLQVLNFSIDSSTMLVNATEIKAMPSYEDCLNNPSYLAEASLQLPPDGPFVLSTNNYFAVVGCRAIGECDFSIGNVNFSITGIVSCTSGCYNQFGFDFCNDFACCVNAIGSGTRGLKINGNGNCGFSMVINPSSYSVPKEHKGQLGYGHYGIMLSWGIQLLDSSYNCSNINGTLSYACANNALCTDVAFQDSLYAYTCSCPAGYSGDGYRDAIGCNDIDECSSKDLNACVAEPAGRCTNTMGSYECRCNPGYAGDTCADIDECAKASDDCERPPRGVCINTAGSYECSCSNGYAGVGKRGTCHRVILRIIIGGVLGAAILVVLSFVAYGSRRAYLVRRRRSENFRRNGGDQLVQGRSMVFSEEELSKATDNFSRKRELGKGGFGTVYWGILPPPHGKVAIKRAKLMADGETESEQVRSFVAEISALGKVRHSNVVRLLGCCVETRVPLLVYEFVENGSVWDHLHSTQYKEVSPLSRNWSRRLDIAVGAASALSYLHSMEPPILHRDVKSANILLDASYNAKVADFGASCSLASGATHLTFAPQGAVGTRSYVDPEYCNTLRVTDRSDVYSFGVVLLELFTSMPPDLGPVLGFLSHHFKEMYESGELAGVVDPKLVMNDSDGANMASVEDVAALAMRCLATVGRERPTMEKVCRSLKGIQRRHRVNTIDVDVEHATGSAARYDSEVDRRVESWSLLASSSTTTATAAWEDITHVLNHNSYYGV